VQVWGLGFKATGISQDLGANKARDSRAEMMDDPPFLTVNLNHTIVAQTKSTALNPRS